MHNWQTRMIGAGLLVLLASGCSTTHQPRPDPDFAFVRPPAVEPLPVHDGAIYKSGHEMTLFQDRRARRVGDIITVVLTESTSASKSASTNTTKESELDMPGPTLFGRNPTVGGHDILNNSVESDREFTGEGDSSQSNSLTGRLTVSVVEVLANGNLVVRGEKMLTLNQGSEHIRLSGVIRPEDISPQNTVLSTSVANARIIYGGEGVLAEANTKGWLSRFFDSPIWPF